MGSALPDPETDSAAAAPIPPPRLSNKPAPGMKGPVGLAPRTTYSRVNTGSPPIPDAGSQSQKSIQPRGLESLPMKTAEVQMSESMITTPSLQELLKQAMEGTASKVDIAAEAVRQQLGHEPEKTASAEVDPSHIPTDYVTKLADAIDYIASEHEKQASIHLSGKASGGVSPGEGPGALHVMQAQASGKNVDAGQQGHGHHQPPMHPASASSGVAKDPATGLETNMGMRHGEQPVSPIANEHGHIGPSHGAKHAEALFTANLERLFKVGSAPVEETTGVPVSAIRKLAEDAINPAQISAGKAEPPESSASEEAVPAQPSDVSRQENMISSSQAAINYTKRDAKADPKKDLAQVFVEPALSAATDKTLAEAFEHTNQAGVKISSAQKMAGETMKVAAARSLLSELAEKIATGEDVKKKGKEKSSGLGAGAAAPTSVQSPQFSG